MSSFAETLSATERKQARIYAYFACYFGCISEVMIDSSAIIILYISMLGGNNMLVMLSTSLSGILNVLLLVPCAAAVTYIGMKRAVSIACIVGCCGFLLMAAAPMLGAYQKIAAMIGCTIYCAQRGLYSVTWYPMLDAFLLPQERGRFFGTMRYSYMLISGALFFMLGKLMGKNPPLLLMQAIIAVTGILVLGRMFCMLRFPDNTIERTPKLKIRQALGISIRNGPLVSYSVYVCLLSIAYTSLIPLTLLYLKNHIQLPAGQVQIFSTIGIAGSITGFFLYGKLSDKFKIKHLELFVHVAFTLAAFAMALLNKNTPGFIYLAGFIYFMISYASSTFLCNNSSELLALARPGNKPMAMAFLQTYQNLGVALGRTGTAMILGANLLATNWQLGAMSISHYQTIFLLCGTIAATILILFPTLPAVVPKHKDYYAPFH